MYLSYDYYINNGGIYSDINFDFWEKKAEYKLNSFCIDPATGINRINLLSPIPDYVKDTMVEFINLMYEDSDNDLQKITSINNMGVSMSIDNADLGLKLYDIVVERFPISLISRGVCYE